MPPTRPSSVRARRATRARYRSPLAPRCDCPRQRDRPSAGRAERPARTVATLSSPGTVAHGAVYSTNACRARRSASNVPERRVATRSRAHSYPLVPIRLATRPRSRAAPHPPTPRRRTARHRRVTRDANAGHNAAAASRRRSRRRARTHDGPARLARCSRNAPRERDQTNGAGARAVARWGLESRTPSEPRVPLASSDPFASVSCEEPVPSGPSALRDGA